MSTAPAHRFGIGRRIPDVLLLLVAALATAFALASVWSTQHPPTTDLPSWMALGSLLAPPWGPALWEHYTLQFTPNLASTLPIAILSPLVSAETSARIACSLALIGLPCSAWLLSRTTWATPRPGWVIGVLLAQHIAVLNGQIGFAISFPLALGSGSVLYAIWPRRSFPLVLLGAGLGVLVLCCHALAWWVFASIAIACALCWPHPRPVRTLAVLLGPSAALFALWVACGSGLPAAPQWWGLSGRLHALASLLPVAVFEPLRHPLPVSVISVLACIGILVLLTDRLVVRDPRSLIPERGRGRTTWVAGLLCLGSGLVAPDQIGALYGAPGRLLLAGVVLIAIAAAAPTRARPRHWFVVTVALTATSSNLIGGLEVQSAIRTCKMAANDLPGGSAVFELPGASPNTDLLRRFAVHVHPLRHAHAFRILDEEGPSCALFRTGPLRPTSCPEEAYPIARGATAEALAASIRTGAGALETHTAFLSGEAELVGEVSRLLGPDRGSAHCRVVTIRR